MQQRASGKRRTGYAYLDSSPKTLGVGDPPPKPVEPVRHPGTVKAQLLGKLGPRGFQRLVGKLRDITEAAA